MKKIGFIGAFDKTDLIIYVAKIIKRTLKSVLIVDSTTLGKARYTVPAISPSRVYVTEFEGIDFAIGFNSLEEVANYLGSSEAELEYDYIFIDIDNPENFKRFNVEKNDENFFVTGFDNYSLKRGLEIIGKLEEKVLMTKVMFSKDMLQEEEDYLNFLAFYYSVQWGKDKIYFPLEFGDGAVIIENQRAAIITFRNLSPEYKQGLEIMANLILKNEKYGEIKKIIKSI